MLGRDFSHKSLGEMLEKSTRFGRVEAFLPSSNQLHYFNGSLRKVVMACKKSGWVPGDAENLTLRHGKIGLDMSGV